MLTAGITAAVAGLLSLFGIKPGPYLVGVAIVVKIIVVAVSLTFGARWWRRKNAGATTAVTVGGSAANPEGSTSPTNNRADGVESGSSRG